MGGKKGFNKLLGYMEASKNKTKLAVVMGQEHNAKKSEFQDLRDAAQIRGFQLIITAGYADNTQSLTLSRHSAQNVRRVAYLEFQRSEIKIAR